jgi:RNA 3'-terminal phosphate cyclase
MAEELASFLASGNGLTGDLAAMLLPYMAAARGMSRVTLDRISPGLKAAARAVESVWPGTVRLIQSPGGGPTEMRVQGRDMGRAL